MSHDDRHLLRALLASADSGAAFQPARRADDSEVIALARHHRLSPLLAATKPAGFSTAAMETFQRDRLATLGRSTLFRHALGALLSAFDDAGVEVAVLKGIAYEDLIYRHPGSRPASDIDILVHPRQRRTVFEALGRLGYDPCASAPGFDEPDYHEVSFRRRDINVDLHFALAPLVRCRIDYAALWSEMQMWNFAGRPTRTLGFVHAALNQALHMAIHHFDVPAIYLLDFRRLLDAAGPGGLERLRANATEWKCARALGTTLALAEAFLTPDGGPGSSVDIGDRGGRVARRVVTSFGARTPIHRLEQLVRKVAHFDDVGVTLAYLWVQGRRVARERWIAASRDGRSAAERLGIPGKRSPRVTKEE